MAAKIFYFFFAAIIIALSFQQSVFSDNQKYIYQEAKEAVARGDLDFAFMRFRDIAENPTKLDLTKKALFAVAEYYFLINNYKASVSSFYKFIRDYPEGEERLFSLMYILKIAQSHKDINLERDLTKEIVSFQQLSLIFRDSQEVEYLSSLGRSCKAIYFIDKIEFYIDGQLFTEVSY